MTPPASARRVALVFFAALAGCDGCACATAASTAQLSSDCLPLTTNWLDDPHRSCTTRFATLEGSFPFTVHTGVSFISTVHVAADVTVEKGTVVVSVVRPDGTTRTITVSPEKPGSLEEDVRVTGMSDTKLFTVAFEAQGGRAEKVEARLRYVQK